MKIQLLIILMIVLSVQSSRIKIHRNGHNLDLKIQELANGTLFIKQLITQEASKSVPEQDILKAIIHCLIRKIMDVNMPDSVSDTMMQLIIHTLKNKDLTDLLKIIKEFNIYNPQAPDLICKDTNNANDINKDDNDDEITTRLPDKIIPTSPPVNIDSDDDDDDEHINEDIDNTQIVYPATKKPSSADLFGYEGIITRDFKHNAIIYSEDQLARICAGAILNKKLVLTSATCIANNKLNKLQVITGPYENNQRYNISKAYFPSKDHQLDNIAVLKVSTPMHLKSLTSISPAFLPPMGKVHVTGSHCRCTGSVVLYEGVMKVIPKPDCMDHYSEIGSESFCVLPEDGSTGRKCYEEQGAAVVSAGRVVGVVGTIQGGKPSRYITIRPFKKWLLRICASNGHC